jgi:hypothetical protein
MHGGDATIEFLKHRWQGVALGLHITRGRDHDAEYVDRLHSSSSFSAGSS